LADLEQDRDDGRVALGSHHHHELQHPLGSEQVMLAFYQTPPAAHKTSVALHVGTPRISLSLTIGIVIEVSTIVLVGL